MQTISMQKVSVLAIAFLATVTTCRGEFPRFEEVVVDPEAAQKAVYAVTLADVDGDSRDDIVAVTENAVVWYQNPDWTRHVIIENQTEADNVCIAPHDIDGDGDVDFALGAGWTKTGTIQWLQRRTNLDQPWKVHAISVEPWTHRMRWADVLGKGTPQLVVSPLNATRGDGVQLTAYAIPAEPTQDRWRSTVLDESLNRLHNHWHEDLNGDGVAETLTASQEGVSLIGRAADGDFRRRLLSPGMAGNEPQESGAGEVKFGRLENGKRFLATIEPMHGTSVVIYTKPEGPLEEGQSLARLVIEDTLAQGHAVWIVNLDADSAHEVVVGHREPGNGATRGPGVYIFDPVNAQGTEWKKFIVDDGGMACEDLICGDLNGDDRIDIVAGGRKTRNVKLYLNRSNGTRRD